MDTPHKKHSRHLYSIALIMLLTVLTLTACGSRRVDEKLLPTAVPTLGIEQVAALPVTEPTATATALPTLSPTAPAVEKASNVISETTTVASGAAQPESPLPMMSVNTSAELTQTSELAATSEVTVPSEIAVAPELTATLELTPTPVIAVSATLTPTATAEATVTPTLSATATLVATATVTIDAVQPITQTETVTTTQSEGGAPANDGSAGILPATIAEKLASADKANGLLLTQKNACIGCHSLSEDVKLVGPSWYGLADQAGERVKGQSAEEYLYASIVKPNEFVVEGYASGLMLQTYGETLSEQDMADIISYLLTLKAH